MWRWLFPKITHEWCVVGNTIGRHSWLVEKRKCKNGVPVGSGWFLTIYKCSNKEAAETLCDEFRQIAEDVNRKKYGPFV